jgi:hypothetical protein
MSFDSTSPVALINVDGVDLSIRSGRWDTKEGWEVAECHLERSEGAEAELRLLRFAQNDIMTLT